jgi:diguanylate cyclase (GGDEF)-like protein
MTMSAIRSWIRGLSRTSRDALLILAMVLPVYGLLLWIDAFDRFYDYSRAHEDWELDEIAALIFALGVAAGFFALRRWLDLRQEVSRRRVAEDEANALARHDMLTGLPNRRHFVDKAAKEIAALRKGCECAIFLIDLDFFKPVNDLYGHDVGDLVLREVAQRLGQASDGEGLVARLGGDEFGFLISCAQFGGIPERIARRIVHDFAEPFIVAERSIKLGVSVGISTVPFEPPQDETSEDRLSLHLRRADLAMYRAKTEGRSQYRFFEQEMDDKLRLHMQLESELAGAIAAGDIVPYYQQLVDLSSNEVVGCEILARWQHPVHGILSPATFIPIAEDTGLIGRLMISVLRQAVKEVANWSSQMYLSLNLSPRQLADPWLAQEILIILSKSAFPPHRLQLEITESGLVDKIDEVRGLLESLRNLGVRIALDDFGTGYSGLYHLRQLSIDTIKIDQSFVSHMLANHEEEKIVEAVINLSNSMGMSTVAEGIETPEVLKRLRELGCTSGQGYYFGRPQSASDMRAALTGSSPAAKITA